MSCLVGRGVLYVDAWIIHSWILRRNSYVIAMPHAGIKLARGRVGGCVGELVGTVSGCVGGCFGELASTVNGRVGECVDELVGTVS